MTSVYLDTRFAHGMGRIRAGSFVDPTNVTRVCIESRTEIMSVSQAMM